jgi:hypothetical protein
VAVYYFLTKSRWVRAGLVSGLVLALSAPFVDFGFANGFALYQSFLNSLGRYHESNSFVESTNLQCLPSLLARILPLAFVQGPYFSVVSNGLSLALALALLAFIFRKGRRITDPVFRNSLWALVLCLMIFINPSSLGHYLVFFIPAVAAGLELLSRLDHARAEGMLLWLGALILMLVVDGMIGRTASHALQNMGMPAVGMLVVCVSLWLCVYRYSRAAVSPAVVV